eukprot:COSAG06_NODE_244_length_19215_cov_20.256853_13_plen_82_part_00
MLRPVSLRSDVSMLLPEVLGPSMFWVVRSWTIDASYRWFWFSRTTEFCTKRAWPLPSCPSRTSACRSARGKGRRAGTGSGY